ncbi:MAG: hypothetical protein P3X22_001750 [Thermoprotei archaeon]|nr:hypothetical protein [Thermoprotei archaeon]
MLKTSLIVGPGFDRFLETVSRALASLLEAAASEGFLRIYSYPSLDSLAAASIVYSRALKLGVRVSLSVALEPPPQVFEPTVLLGFGSLNYKSNSVTSKLIAFYSGELKSIPVHGATYVDGQGSLSSMVFMALTGARDFDPTVLTAFLTGSYSGGFVDPSGRFQGLDREAFERLKSSRAPVDVVTTIKVYKPTVRDACTGIAHTLNPYYPGLTGHKDRCLELLENSGLRDVTGRPLSTLDHKALEAIVAAVTEGVRRISGVSLKRADIVSAIVVSADPRMPKDFREASDTLIYAAEHTGSLHRITATLIDLEVEYPMAEGRLEAYATRLSNIASTMKPQRVKGSPNIKIYEAPLNPQDPPTMAWRAFKLLGMVESDSIIACRVDDELAASPLQVEEALGPGGAKRLVELGMAKFEGGLLWVKKLNARQN